jgi:hypothetical protein
MKTPYSELDAVTKEVEAAVSRSGKFIEPVRTSLFKRFPILGTLLVTFGVTATVYGLERIIADITWLYERPMVIFTAGILTLIFTGKLYQKLG